MLVKLNRQVENDLNLTDINRESTVDMLTKYLLKEHT